jgi:hypothetical protein
LDRSEGLINTNRFLPVFLFTSFTRESSISLNSRGLIIPCEIGALTSPLYQSMLSAPKHNVIERSSDTGSGAASTGIAIRISVGFDKDVVSIKKVMSKKARSTIAVKSTFGKDFNVLPLLSDEQEDVFNSAMAYVSILMPFCIKFHKSP